MQGETPRRQSLLSKSGQSSTEVLFFLNVCPYVVVLDECNIAVFAFKSKFSLGGSDTFETV